jgi:hypothetical protein
MGHAAARSSFFKREFTHSYAASSGRPGVQSGVRKVFGLANGAGVGNAGLRRSHHDRQLDAAGRQNGSGQPDGEKSTSTQ